MEDGINVQIAKRISLRHDPDDERVEIDPTYLSLTQEYKFNKVFVLSEYIHKATQLVENVMTGIYNVEVDGLKEIYKQVDTFVQQKRMEISMAHRSLIWTIKCRIKAILFIAARVNIKSNGYIKMENINESKLEYGTFKELKDLKQFLITKINISDYNLQQFWTSLNILIEKIRYVEYSSLLKKYVDYLELCCAKFISNVFENKKILNQFHLSMEVKTPNGQTVYAVNRQFVKETESIFFELDLMFEFRRKFDFQNTEKILLNSKSIERFNEIIITLATTKYNSFVNRFLGLRIYNNYVYPSEEYRYVTENPLVDPTAYNIIGKMKPSLLTKLVNKFSANPIKAILDSRKENNSNNLDNDFALLCIITLNFYFELNGIPDKFEGFIIYPKHLPDISRYIDQSNNYPYIVNIFNNYEVLYGRRIFKCNSFNEAFLTWLYLVCSEKHGILPSNEGNLSRLFMELFPDQDDIIKDLESNSYVKRDIVPHLDSKPEFYKKGVVML